MTEGVLAPEDHPGSDSQLVEGDTFTGFLQEVVNEDARDSVRASAINVLNGALTEGPGSTGLVVGRVQSGKTLSYEGVIALARDNGFSLVIVISGISNPLLTQGERRLKGDLGSADRDGWLFAVPNDKQQSLPRSFVGRLSSSDRASTRPLGPDSGMAVRQCAALRCGGGSPGPRS